MANRLLFLVAVLFALPAHADWTQISDQSVADTERLREWTYSWTGTATDSGVLDLTACDQVEAKFDPSTGDTSTGASLILNEVPHSDSERSEGRALNFSPASETSYVPLNTTQKYLMADVLTATAGGDVALLTVRCTRAQTQTLVGQGDLDAASQCELTHAFPAECQSAQLVSSIEDIEACAEGATVDGSGVAVCYVTGRHSVTDPAGVSGFLWNVRTDIPTFITVVCAPGAGFNMDFTTANANATDKAIVNPRLTFGAATDESSFAIDHCDITQTINGVAIGGAGVVDGIRTTHLGTPTTHDIKIRYAYNRVSVHSSGTGGFGIVAGGSSVTIIGNDVTAGVPVEFLGTGTLADNVLRCNLTGNQESVGFTANAITGMSMSAVAIDNRFFGGCGPSVANASSLSARVEFRGRNIFYSPILEGFFRLTKNGTGTLTVLGTLEIAEDLTATTYVDMIGNQGLPTTTDLTINIRSGCPNAQTWLDADGVTNGAAPSYARILGRINPGCTVPTAANMISTGSDAELNTYDTLGIVKVDNQATATVSLLANAAAPTDFTLADAIPGSVEVFSSAADGAGRSALANPVDTDFDTGNEIAAYFDRRCLAVNLANGTASTCTADQEAAGFVEVLGH